MQNTARILLKVCRLSHNAITPRPGNHGFAFLMSDPVTGEYFFSLECPNRGCKDTFKVRIDTQEAQKLKEQYGI